MLRNRVLTDTYAVCSVTRMSKRIEDLQADLAAAHEDAEAATDPYDAAGYRLLAKELARQLDQERISRPFTEHELTFE